MTSHTETIFNHEFGQTITPVIREAKTALHNILFDGTIENVLKKNRRFAFVSSHLLAETTSPELPIHKKHTLGELSFRTEQDVLQHTPRVVFIGTKNDLLQMNILSSEWDTSQSLIKIQSSDGIRSFTIRNGHATFDIVTARADLSGIETPEVVFRSNVGTELPSETPEPADMILICVGFRTLDLQTGKSIGTINVVNAEKLG